MPTDIPIVASFPLPFRVLFLVGLGMLCWATNLHGLQLLGIDVKTVLGIWTFDGHRSPLPTKGTYSEPKSVRDLAVYAPIYRVTVVYCVWCLVAWVAFRYFVGGDAARADFFRYIPALCWIVILMVLVCPFDLLQKRERDSFLYCTRRCLFQSVNLPVYFCDVVFADILTSFAKVLGDVYLSACMLLPYSSLLRLPAIVGWTQWILPSIMSLPYLVRFCQCLIEHFQLEDENRRPLLNALKYASSFPVIFLSAAQRLVESELIQEKGNQAAEEAWHGEHPLFRMWLLAAVVNSLYSFWWDVTNDWGLDLLRFRPPNVPPYKTVTPPRPLVLPALHSKPSSLDEDRLHSPSPFGDNESSNPRSSHGFSLRSIYGLRPSLLYPIPVYPLVIFLNLILRLTWSIKLSSHLHSQSEGSVAIFWLEVAEALRRWMWVFLRIEWEVIKRTEGRRGKRMSSTGRENEDEYELLSTGS